MMFNHDDNASPSTDSQATSQPSADGNMQIPDSLLTPEPTSDVMRSSAPAPAMVSPTVAQLVMNDITAPTIPKDTDETTKPKSNEDGLAKPADDLLDLKQKAVAELSPLLNHLEQTPEEKFRTTMMMIQTTDNQELIKTAYEAAQKITDEKARAEALLDIVNEINYFTQHPTA